MVCDAPQSGDGNDGAKMRSRRRGAGNSAPPGSTELRDTSADAQETVVCRLFSKVERRLESQWKDTRAEVRSSVLELGAIERQRMQKLEARQTTTEGRLSEHDGGLEAQAARLGRIEAELLYAKTSPPPSCGA